MARSSFVLDVFIGGFWDRYTRLVAEYRKGFGRRHRQHCTCYFEHDQCDAIVAAVLAAARGTSAPPRINLIGHSWGAACAHRAAARLAKRGLAIDLLVTADPVGRRRRGVLADTTTWINLNAAPASSNGLRGDYYALLGGKWGEWPCGRAQQHYDLPFHHNEFGALMNCAPPGSCSAHRRLLGEHRTSLHECGFPPAFSGTNAILISPDIAAPCFQDCSPKPKPR